LQEVAKKAGEFAQVFGSGDWASLAGLWHDLGKFLPDWQEYLRRKTGYDEDAHIEGFQAMREDLESEKRAMQKIWANREKQIEKIISNTAGMYGDLEGLAGSALPQIRILELPTGENIEKRTKETE
jgi:hypothetical protein